MEFNMNKKAQVIGWIFLFVIVIAGVSILWLSYGRTIPVINQNLSSAAENVTIENTRTAMLDFFDMSSVLFWLIAAGVLIVAAIMMFKA